MSRQKWAQSQVPRQVIEMPAVITHLRSLLFIIVFTGIFSFIPPSQSISRDTIATKGCGPYSRT